MGVEEKDSQADYEVYMKDAKEKRATDSRTVSAKEGAKARSPPPLSRPTSSPHLSLSPQLSPSPRPGAHLSLSPHLLSLAGEAGAEQLPHTFPLSSKAYRHMCVYIYISLSLSIYIYIYLHITCICICVCIYIYIYIYAYVYYYHCYNNNNNYYYYHYYYYYYVYYYYYYYYYYYSYCLSRGRGGRGAARRPQEAREEVEAQGGVQHGQEAQGRGDARNHQISMVFQLPFQALFFVYK